MTVKDLLNKFLDSDSVDKIVIECVNDSYDSFEMSAVIHEHFYRAININHKDIMNKEVGTFHFSNRKMYVYTKDSKQITIVDVDFDNETHVINNEQELFDLYNNFMIVHYDLIDLGENVDKYDIDTMEKIRDEYSLIWKETVGGAYTLEDFEKRALEIIEGEK